MEEKVTKLLCNTRCVPGPGPGGLVLVYCKVPPTTLGSRWSDTHLTDAETEAHSSSGSILLVSLLYKLFSDLAVHHGSL